MNNLEKLPDAITSLIGLEELFLNDTFLEFLPANFGRLTNLRILELRDNNLITLPKSMSRLQQLRRIDIGNNEFQELPEIIGNLVNLTELWCDGNRIRRMNGSVGNLKELIHFDASNNLLQFLPAEVGNWQSLQELCLSSNELEELPFSIGLMKSLVTLKVDENQLQELPDSICELANLEELMISHNDLFKLPTTIGLLRRLRFLTADENLLRTLPNELCSCINLTILSVRGNKLTKVPPDIGHLTQLRVLNVVNNFLTQLPVTILNLRQLSALWISDNQSQPLMPLQKEFSDGNFYLTCYLLPQVASQTTPNGNFDGEPVVNYSHSNIEADATMNMKYPNSNSHKRKICFASDPIQEITPIDQTSRLMRSPTPYPKELRVMSKFTTKNSTQQQQQLQQQHQQRVNSIKNQATSPEADDTYDSQAMFNRPVHPKENGNPHVSDPNGSETIANDSYVLNDEPRYTVDSQGNRKLSGKPEPVEIKEARITATSFEHARAPYSQKHQFESNSSDNYTPEIAHQNDYMPQKYTTFQTPTNDNESMSSKSMQQNSTQFTETTPYNVSHFSNQIHPYEHHSQQLHQPQNIYTDYPTFVTDNHIHNNNEANVQLSQDITDSHTYPVIAGTKNYNTSYYDQDNTQHYIDNDTNNKYANSKPYQQPPPYHIAKRFTNKSKQDLLIYDIYRNNYQQQHQQSQMPNTQTDQILDNYHEQMQPHTLQSMNAIIDTSLDKNSNFLPHQGRDHEEDGVDGSETNSSILKNAKRVDNSPDSASSAQQNSSIKSSTSWLFGLHKNPTVVSVFLPV